jgi:3-phenylpropionate/trans-cinnamate dioxygenase ferredoxin subunit
MYNWFKAEGISAAALEENKIIELLIADKRVALVKKQQDLFAFAATCPHAGAPFCTAWLNASGQIVCALHKYRFNPANGHNVSGEGYKLKTYPIEVRNDEIFIGLLTS